MPTDLPKAETLFMDIGAQSIALFQKEIAQAGTVFVNGPVKRTKSRCLRRAHE